MSTRKDAGERIALLQGTLDLLIWRTLVFGRPHGQGIAPEQRARLVGVLRREIRHVAVPTPN